MKFPRFRSSAALRVTTIALIAAGTGRAQTPSCEDLSHFVCDAAGFTFELTDEQSAAQSDSGSSTWTYEVCVDSSLCPLPAAFRDLSHFNIVLPGYHAPVPHRTILVARLRWPNVTSSAVTSTTENALRWN